MKKGLLILASLFTGLALTACDTGGGGGSGGGGGGGGGGGQDEPHTHEFSSDWMHDSSTHWHPATCGHDVKKDEASHSYDARVEVIEEATCTENGEEKHYCICGDYINVPVACKGHTIVPFEEVEATCFPGYTGGSYCSECGEVLEERTVVPPAYNHSPKKMDNVKPTCTENGSIGGLICSMCGSIIEKPHVLKAHGHSFEYTVSKEPTHLEDGEKIGVCSECQHEEKVVIPSLAYEESDIWDGSVANSFDGGSGTEEDPYQIATAAQLAYLASDEYIQANYQNYYYYKLTKDIVLNDSWNYESWTKDSKLNEWKPIGETVANYPYYRFKGSFDGNNYSIYGMFINNNSDSTDYLGLFAHIDSDSVIENLNVTESVIFSTKGSPNIGGIVACLEKDPNYGATCTIEHCSFNGIINGGTAQSIGGILGTTTYHVGGTNQTINIKNCETDGRYENTSTSSDRSVGGVIGYIGDYISYANIADNVNRAEVVGEYNVGGIIGTVLKVSNRDLSVERCKNYGKIKANKSYAGGIMGYFEDANTHGYFKGCVNFGDVTAKSFAGGITGFLMNEYGFSIKGCVNNGNITGLDNKSHVGGISGYIKQVDRFYSSNSSGLMDCFNNGYVKGEEMVGGIAGEAANAWVYRVYNSGYVEGEMKVGGLIGYSNVGDVTEVYCLASNSYNAGVVYDIGTSFTNDVGAIVGKAPDRFEIENCDYRMFSARNSSGYYCSVGGLAEESCAQSMSFEDMMTNVENYTCSECGYLSLDYPTVDYCFAIFDSILDSNYNPWFRGGLLLAVYGLILEPEIVG